MPLIGALRALPTRCGVCQLWGWRSWCENCLHAHAADNSVWPRCLHCGLRIPPGVLTCAECSREPPPQAATVVAVDYAFPWDALIARMKFQAQPQEAAPLAELMIRALRQQAIDPATVVMPLPLSPQRLRERGYNQAWELARRVARALRLKALPQGLKRHVDLPRQSALPREQRLSRLQGVFSVEPAELQAWIGKPVALVDDVYTTGATVSEATRVLLQAGAQQVQVWALARTPAPPETAD